MSSFSHNWTREEHRKKQRQTEDRIDRYLQGMREDSTPDDNAGHGTRPENNWEWSNSIKEIVSGPQPATTTTDLAISHATVAEDVETV